MRRFEFQKLIRDGILGNMQEEGCDIDYRRLEREELRQALADKLAEESRELQEADQGDEFLEELNDIELVLEALRGILSDTDRQKLPQLHEEKLAEKGGFQEGIWIESVAVPEDSPWLEYLAANYQEMEE